MKIFILAAAAGLSYLAYANYKREKKEKEQVQLPSVDKQINKNLGEMFT